MITGMWAKLQKLFDRLESRWSLYGLLGGSGTVSAMSGWIAAHTKWLDGYGAIGWWFAALCGGLLFAMIFLAICWGRWKLIQAKAVNQWSKAVDAFNPLEREFRNLRISLAELANPVTKEIAGKRFINCELIGPATILLGNGNGFRQSEFYNVNMIPVKDNYPISPLYMLVGCDVIESRIMDANILFPLTAVPMLEAGFNQSLPYISLTGVAEIDNRPPPGTGP